MKKLLILAPADNPHTIRWVNYLSKLGYEIILFTLGSFSKSNYIENNVVIYSLEQQINKQGSFISKVKYIKALPMLKGLVTKYNPDIVHAHYATSYGVLGALLKFKPFILSVWGSDVYLFPKKSIIHKLLLKYSLSKANLILSTSYDMKRETLKYTKKNIKVIPFGIDLTIFKNKKSKGILSDSIRGSLVIGTVKSLEKVYGIEYLIKGFNIVLKQNKSLKLVIVGRGDEELHLKTLVKELNIEDNVIFTGYIDPVDVYKYHNIMDIEVFMSESESFGVSVIEASACENPVIVSNVGGLPEVVKENLTGYIVESKNYIQLSEQMQRLIDDTELRENMGKNGRKMVEKDYNLMDNISEMSNIYKKCKV
jgi:L-malate glycosyltransferase